MSESWLPCRAPEGEIKYEGAMMLAIDQVRTASSRAIIFDLAMKVVASSQMEFKQHCPTSGWDLADAVATGTRTSAFGTIGPKADRLLPARFGWSVSQRRS